MAEDLKNLIDKIQKEGVQEAQAKAAEIEAAAQRRSQEIIQKAEQKAQRIIEDAQTVVTRKQESTHAALRQAGRDLVLSLKKQLVALLEAAIDEKVGQALRPEAMSALIIELIKNSEKKTDKAIVLTLSKQDAEKLEKGILAELQNKIKQGIEVRPSEDVRSGFRVSFDAAQSHFDFTDEALIDYISTYLKPTLAEILKEEKQGTHK